MGERIRAKRTKSKPKHSLEHEKTSHPYGVHEKMQSNLQENATAIWLYSDWLFFVFQIAK